MAKAILAMTLLKCNFASKLLGFHTTLFSAAQKKAPFGMTGWGKVYAARSFARCKNLRIEMYIHPISNSYHFTENFALDGDL